MMADSPDTRALREIIRSYRGQEECAVCSFRWMDAVPNNRWQHARKHLSFTRGVWAGNLTATTDGFLLVTPLDRAALQEPAYMLSRAMSHEMEYDGPLAPYPKRLPAWADDIVLDGTRTLVALRDGWAIGHMVIRWRPRIGWWRPRSGVIEQEHGPPGWSLDAIHVLPAYRRQGIATSLLTEASGRLCTPAAALLWLHPLSLSSQALIRARIGTERIGIS